jgi:hypothetical protein
MINIKKKFNLVVISTKKMQNTSKPWVSFKDHLGIKF